MRVRIAKCSDRERWHQDHIGDIFEVIKETVVANDRMQAIPSYQVRITRKEFGMVPKTDVDVVEE